MPWSLGALARVPLIELMAVQKRSLIWPQVPDRRPMPREADLASGPVIPAVPSVGALTMGWKAMPVKGPV